MYEYYCREHFRTLVAALTFLDMPKGLCANSQIG